MRCVQAQLCSSVQFVSAAGRITNMHLLEQPIRAAALPVAVEHFVITLILEDVPTNAVLATTFVFPSGERVGPFFEPTCENTDASDGWMAIAFQNVEFAEYGRHRIEIREKDAGFLFKIEFDVNKMEE